MNSRLTIILSLILSFIIFNGCYSEPDYETMVRQGIESGVENNDLFLGYELGMTRDDFFEISWEMNQNEEITGLVKIEYTIDDLRGRATKRFYPDFADDKISKMPIDIHYHSWAPWNHEFSSDTLVTDLVDYYSEIYETSFRKVYVPHLEKEACVSIEGNRAITLSTKTDMIARIEFIDLNQVQPIED